MIAESALKADFLQTGRQNSRIAGLFQQTIRQNPKGFAVQGAQFRLNKILYNQGRYQEAVTAWKKFLKKYRTSYLRYEALLNLAMAQAAQNLWNEAERTTNELTSLNPAYEEQDAVKFLKGVFAFMRLDYQTAAAYLEKMSVPTAASLYWRALNYRAAGRPVLAAQKFQEQLNKFPNAALNEQARYLLADSHFAGQDYISAIKDFENFLHLYPESPYRAAAYYKLGASQFAEGNYPACREALSAAAQGFPAQQNASQRNFPHNLSQAKEPDEPEKPANEFAPWALYLLGEANLKENRSAEAAYAYGKMAGRFSGHPFAANALYKLSWCHFQSADWAASQNSLERLIRLYPNHRVIPYAYLLLGTALLRQEKFSEAAQVYQKSVDLAFPEEAAETAAALANEAGYKNKNYGALISAYHLMADNFPPTADPQRAWTYLFIAEGYLRKGFYESALKIYQAILREYPASPAWPYAQDGLAWSLFKMSRWQEALKARNLIESLGKSGAVAPGLQATNAYERANILFNMKKYSEALEQYEKFISDNPAHDKTGQAGLRTGLCYSQMGFHGQAVAAWQALRRDQPDSQAAAEALWKIADTYFRAAKYGEAIKTYETIIASQPKEADMAQARLRIAQSRYNSRDYGQAMEAFKILILSHPSSAEAKEGLEFLISMLDKPPHRRTAQENLSGLAASLGEASALGSEALFALAENYFAGKDFSRAALELQKLDSAHFEAERLSLKEYYLGEAYYQTGRWKRAIRAFERLLESFPKDDKKPFALFRLGAAHFKLENYKEAAGFFETLAREFPKSEYAADGLFNAAMSCKKAKLWRQSQEAFLSYLSKFPDKAEETKARDELAGLFEEQKKFNEAQVQLEEILREEDRSSPRWRQTAVRLAGLYLLEDKEERARQIYENMLSLAGPYDEWRLAAAVRLADIYEKNRRWPEAAKIYETLSRETSGAEVVQAAKARLDYIRTNYGEFFAAGEKTGVKKGEK
ncbi:MAG: tetratricopeptide repeat protein [Elusimicrobia bacterium]|nr:tetratricopeptide repeat protein [Elusimicrobiota bacterium]